MLYLDEWLARERYRERLREARNAALVHAALGQSAASRPIYGPVLIWLGWRLSGWGQRLITRYNRPEPICGTLARR